MSFRKRGLLLFLIVALIGTVGAVGQMFVSIPAISQHFSYQPEDYWYHRLVASLILGSNGLYFVALMLWLGYILLLSKDKGKQAAGKYILILSLIPQMVNFVTLPVLTPSDWPHMITHGLILTFIPLGLWWYKKA